MDWLQLRDRARLEAAADVIESKNIKELEIRAIFPDGVMQKPITAVDAVIGGRRIRTGELGDWSGASPTGPLLYPDSSPCMVYVILLCIYNNMGYNYLRSEPSSTASQS